MNSNNSQGLPARMIPIAISAIVIFVFILVTPALSHGDEPFFSIALSKFSNEEAAKKEEAKLKSSGNNAFYKKEKNPKNGNIEYQVYIEKYGSMEEAIKEAKVLKDLEIISDYLVKEVVDTPIVEETPPETQPEGAGAPQPAGDSNQVPEVKAGVTEIKPPAPDTKTVEGPAPLTGKKDAELKTPETDAKGAIKATADIESKKIEAPLPLADKKEVEKIGVPEQGKASVKIKEEPIPVRKEAIKQTPVPVKPDEQVPSTNEKTANDSILPKIIEPQKQEQTSGQVRREPIPIQKGTVKQPPVPEKQPDQTTSTDQKVANERVLKPEIIEPQKKVPESKPLKDEIKQDVTKPGTVNNNIPKENSQQIKRVEIIPEKATLEQNPATKVPEPAPEKKEPPKLENIDQVKGATLQVGACKEEANAAILKKQLLSLGRTAFYRYETAEGLGDLYRIYITGYKTLGEAVKDAKTLVGSGVITGYARPHSKIPATDIPNKKADGAVNETDGKIYFIHTGSYKEEVNAQRAVASLKESGYKAFYVPEKEPPVIWFRVYIGDFRSEAQAREKGMELLNKGIITYFKPVAITPEEKGN
jgi:cell division septation protein DedD